MRNQAKNIQLSIANVGQILGWEDVVNQRPYVTSARCISQQGKLLAIKIEDFFNHIQKNPAVLDAFDELSQKKNESVLNQLRHAKITKSKLTVSPDNIHQNNTSGNNKNAFHVNPIFRSVISKHNMRSTQDRFQDFRETLKEIVDINQHDKKARDHRELDPEYYGKVVNVNDKDNEDGLLSPKSTKKKEQQNSPQRKTLVKKPTIEIAFSSKSFVGDLDNKQNTRRQTILSQGSATSEKRGLTQDDLHINEHENYSFMISRQPSQVMGKTLGKKMPTMSLTNQDAVMASQ